MNPNKKTLRHFSLVECLKRIWPDALAIVVFLLISFFYFQQPITHGLILGGHDNDASVGLGQDKTEYYQQTGEVSRWTNSVFSGMPTYQISPSYGSTDVLNTIADVYSLGTSGVLAYVFLYLLGFYILLRAFNFKVWLSSLGAIVWAFSSYFFIIIAAGHIWKVMTLGFIPPTIAGLVLCYRGKWLWGGAVTALFTALQILSNHVQMSYYFCFVMLCIVLAYGVASLLKKKNTATEIPDFKGWLKATGVIILAGLLGLAANSSNLYHTYQYSKESMRGKSELPSVTVINGETKKAPADGLDFEYITAWSYGVGETMTLMIPDFKGGGSGESILDTEVAENYPEFLPMAQTLYSEIGVNPPGISCYWGEQPGTVGPVYVGAIICFLFVLGIFVVRGPMKWALLVATMISFIFAWGRNIPEVTHFLIDNLPMYNKFRTVSSALVVAEFTMPLLAMLALAELLKQRDWWRVKMHQVYFIMALLLTAGVCMAYWLCPDLAGNCITNGERDFFNQLIPYQAQLPISLTDYESILTSMRHDILSASAGRSLVLILVAVVALMAYAKIKAVKAWMVCAVLCVACLGEMWKENKRYLNDESFKMPNAQEQMVQKTPADEYILQDKDPHYRVFDVTGFSGNRTSYYHKSVGGYHAAKLRRYQDLIDRHIMKESNVFVQAIYAEQDLLQADTLRLMASADKSQEQIYDELAQRATLEDTLAMPVLNMLNTKYFIFSGGKIALRNYGANGNAWFVRSLDFVKGAPAEIEALRGMDTRQKAVADEKYRSLLEGTALGAGTATLTKYAVNEMHYTMDSQEGGLVVFSEIFYPGWTATIDGEPVEIGRVNYLLRAIKMPAGKHEVVLEYRPTSVITTDVISYIAIVLVLLAFIAALVLSFRGSNQ